MEGLLADLGEAHAKLRHKADLHPDVVSHADALARLQAHMAKRPRVIVLGEANAGKTSLVNLLLDHALLPRSVLANTRRPVVLRFAESVVVTGITRAGRLDLGRGDAVLRHASSLESLEIGLPDTRLESFDLVDTPALSAAARLDSLKFGATDLLLWCTVATQAWKESERRLWTTIGQRHRRRAILVATHTDSLREDDRHKVRARLAAETADGFGGIALVSAAAENFDADRRQHSGAVDLENLIASTLSAMTQHRRRVGYRLANYIVGRALKLMEPGQRGEVTSLSLFRAGRRAA
jgi:Dynamin family